MERFKKSRKFLCIGLSCSFVIAASCSAPLQKASDIVIWEEVVCSQAEEGYSEDVERIAAIYLDACKQRETTDFTNRLEMIQTIIDKLGASGYTAVDSDNQIDMVNAEQVLSFCDAVNAKEKAELTIIKVICWESVNGDASIVHGFRKYDFQTENGRVDIVRGDYCFDVNENLVSEKTVNYCADLWQYTKEGYLVFEGNYFADDYYIISLTDESEYDALRVEPLDSKCRELYCKYIQPVGYEHTNLFLVNWSEGNCGDLDFYDLFDKFYGMLNHKSFPYTPSENPSIGKIYQIEEDEFESVIKTFVDVDTDMIRSKTTYFSEDRIYMYKPRGFYEIGCTNTPYPEVVGYTKNSDGTLTLTVNAVFPYECTSKAFSHEVVIRPLEDGSFQYVSNKMIEKDYDAWWRAERLTDDEWEEVYNSAMQRVSETDESLWYLPQADHSLLTESEINELNNTILAAAEQAKEIYQDMEIEKGASYASNVSNFTMEQCREVVALLGKAGFISVTQDCNMENYEDLEAFYAQYKNGQDAMVTVFDVHSDGLIGAVTFIYSNQKDEIQTYYVGVDWQEGGIPKIKNSLISNVSQINLTEKGYFIYAYEELTVHSAACEYWRVKPLSAKCRELTRKYVAGLSFVNYNAFATNWDSSNIEEILMPCMFADIYRIATGENIHMEKDQIAAEVYERIMMTYFPVSKEQLRSNCEYDADSDSYPYEMISAAPYEPFGEVVDYRENQDGTMTLFVDGVWVDYNTDCAFTSEILVKPFSDGTFRYLSNTILTKDPRLSTVVY